MKRFLLLLTLVALVLGVVYVATDDGTLFPKSTEQTTSEPTPAPATKTAPAPKPVAKPTPAPAPAPAPNPDNAKHLAFKGVPITGTLQHYVESMKSAGFRLISGGNGVARMRGDFAGFKDCKLLVSTIDNHNLVCSIDVFFAEREQWSELHNDYTALKKMLTQKYGSPASCVEKFEGLMSDFVKDDNSKFHELKFDRCKYITTFKTPKGTITLRMDHKDYDCFVRLTYADKINSALVLNTAMSDL
ncbi:MAG: hypothetical protein IKU97_01645 [Tidjanibacter sp.]|nr:hypothetical protein [Tidjanibacter sp.]